MSPNVQNPEIRAKWERLQRLRAAYDDLITGKSRAAVRDGDRESHFARGDAKALLQQIQRLEIELSAQPRTFQVGANVPHGLDPFRRY